jgi:hypothetical protein
MFPFQIPSELKAILIKFYIPLRKNVGAVPTNTSGWTVRKYVLSTIIFPLALMSYQLNSAVESSAMKSEMELRSN